MQSAIGTWTATARLEPITAASAARVGAKSLLATFLFRRKKIQNFLLLRHSEILLNIFCHTKACPSLPHALYKTLDRVVVDKKFSVGKYSAYNVRYWRYLWCYCMVMRSKVEIVRPHNVYDVVLAQRIQRHT